MAFREEHIGRARLILGDCRDVLPTLGEVDHLICDPPYEASLHAAKAHLSNLRRDSGPELKEIDFDCIDPIRERFVELSAEACEGWFIAFCTIEGTRPRKPRPCRGGYQPNVPVPVFQSHCMVVQMTDKSCAVLIKLRAVA